MTLIIAWSLAAAVSARVSWTKRSTTPRTTITSMTTAARRSPVRNETHAKTSSRMTSGIADVVEQAQQRRLPLVAGDLVRPILSHPRRDLRLAQSLGARREPGERRGLVASGPLQQGCGGRRLLPAMNHVVGCVVTVIQASAFISWRASHSPGKSGSISVNPRNKSTAPTPCVSGDAPQVQHGEHGRIKRTEAARNDNVPLVAESHQRFVDLPRRQSCLGNELAVVLVGICVGLTACDHSPANEAWPGPGPYVAVTLSKRAGSAYGINSRLKSWAITS